VSKETESKLEEELLGALAFADEKLDEIVLLTKAIPHADQVVRDSFNVADTALELLKSAKARNRYDVQGGKIRE